ncbi:MAG TPA: hypothetical protein VE953_05330 [Terriglobales bacterium]|nr:hypothetical protein [Terriglobales bacterium]
MRRLQLALVGCAAAAMLALASAPAAMAAAAAAPSPTPAASASPAQSAGPSLPGLQLPTLDPQKVIYQAIAGILFAFDQTLIGEMEQVWNPMVAGQDDLTGKENFGPGLVVDNSQLSKMWTVSFGIATGSLLVMLFALWALLYVVGQTLGSRHDVWRNLVYFLFTVVLMGFSFFLVNQLVTVDNALVSAVNGQVSVELRSVLAFQNLQNAALKDPSGIQDVHDLLKAITTLLVVVFVALELVVLFVVYFVRLILLWVLVVVAPFALAFGIIPAGRGLVAYWCRLLIATVGLKFVNVLVFTTFVLMGAASDVALLNVILVATMLLFMIMVPATLMTALGDPSKGIMAVQDSWRATTHHQPLRQATSGLLSRIRPPR